MKYLNLNDLTPKLNPIVVANNTDLASLEVFLSTTKIFVVDTETNVVPTFIDRRVRTIQIGNRDHQFVIDLLGFNKDLVGTQGNFTCHESYKNLITLLKKYFETNETKKVLFNATFDYTILKWTFGIKMWNLYDCYIAEQNIYTGKIPFTLKGFWALDDCVLRYTGLQISKDQQKTFDLTSSLTKDQIEYAALDVRLPLAVMKAQEPILATMGITNAVQIDCDAIPAFSDQHLNGLLLDKVLWDKRMDEVREEIPRLISQMDKFFIPVVGEVNSNIKPVDFLEDAWRSCEDRELRKKKRKEFEAARRDNKKIMELSSKCQGRALLDYESPQQLLDALLKLGLPANRLKNTAEETLMLLSNEYEVVKLLRRYRGLNKLIGTYGKPYIEAISKDTGRIHAEFRLIGARTGRPSCADPNLFNIPKDPKWRECFVSRPGYKMVTADFSGQELRIMTELSQEPSWVEAFNKDWDVHSIVAEVMYEEEWKTGGILNGSCRGSPVVDKNGESLPDCAYFYNDHKKCKCPIHNKFRDAVKSINFGIAYGMTEIKLADDLDISRAEAKALLNTYYKAVPKLIKYLEDSGKSARDTLTSRTMVGRLRHYLRPTFEFATNRVMLDQKVKKSDREDDTYRKIFIARNKKQIDKKVFMMSLAIEREGKNAVIQGTGCDMLKLAMGCGFDENGKPFLWHYMDELGMFLENSVYDELLVEVPEENVKKAVEIIDDCMVRAGNTFVKSIPFKTEVHVDNHWTK